MSDRASKRLIRLEQQLAEAEAAYRVAYDRWQLPRSHANAFHHLELAREALNAAREKLQRAISRGRR